METQKNVWDNIAEEWHEFKTKPAHHAVEFLNEAYGKVLDFGSGSGRHLSKVKDEKNFLNENSYALPTSSQQSCGVSSSVGNGKMYLLDFSDEMIRLAKEKAKEKGIDAEFIVSEMNKIPFDDEFFDSAICISSLHCVEGEENRKKAVEELYRVLKKDGSAMIGVWNKKSKRFKNASKDKMVNWRDKGSRYYYLYDEDEVHDLFRSVGFEVGESCNTEMMLNFTVKKN